MMKNYQIKYLNLLKSYKIKKIQIKLMKDKNIKFQNKLFKYILIVVIVKQIYLNLKEIQNFKIFQQIKIPLKQRKIVNKKNYYQTRRLNNY